MRHIEHRARIGPHPLFQPLHRIFIQMIGRLIQHQQLRLPGEQRSELHPRLLAPAEQTVGLAPQGRLQLQLPETFLRFGFPAVTVQLHVAVVGFTIFGNCPLIRTTCLFQPAAQLLQSALQLRKLP
ncbi:hypothetical protein D3C73_1314890 [compost metagenome]